MQELVASYEDCAYLAEAVKAVPGAYQPSDQVRAVLLVCGGVRIGEIWANCLHSVGLGR